MQLKRAGGRRQVEEAISQYSGWGRLHDRRHHVKSSCSWMPRARCALPSLRCQPSSRAQAAP
eukprot:2031548-Prymnesium_polylepis.1